MSQTGKNQRGSLKKRCKLCKIDKEIQQFYYRRDTMKRRGLCKSCVSERQRAYRERNADRISKMKLEWQRANPEKKAAIAKRYYEKNRDKINEYVKMYKRHRRTPRQKIRDNLSRRIWRALKGNVAKSQKTMDLIGCSVGDLMQHLESKFEDGMTWANYGEWHMDHIVPCSQFDLRKAREQKRCFHYSNLQPLWAHDNRVKSSTINV